MQIRTTPIRPPSSSNRVTDPQAERSEPNLMDSSFNPIINLVEGSIPEYVSCFEGTSQYTYGGTSACGLAALNAVRIILGREKRGTKGLELLQSIASRNMMEEIVAICARWANQIHLEVDGIAALPLFANTLTLSYSEYHRAEAKHFFTLLERLKEIGQPGHGFSSDPVSSAVVITRPPEILAVFHIPTHYPKHAGIFVVFDSHPRPSKASKGASFTFFPTTAAASHYLSSLLQIDKSLLSGLGSMQWQAQLLSHYSGHVFLARNSYDVEADPMQPIYDANMDILELKTRLADAEERIRSLSGDNLRLSERVRRFEDTAAPTARKRSPIPICATHTWFSQGPLQFSLDRNIAPSTAGPSRRGETSQDRSVKSPGRTFDDQQSSPRQQERADAALAARLYREQDKELASLALARRTQETLDQEDAELHSERRALQKMAQVLFECTICFENFPEDFVARVDGCGHELCRPCMKEFVTLKLGEHRYPITCPICPIDPKMGEPSAITGRLIEQIGLTEAQQAIWVELELSEFSIMLDCPKCRRSTFVDRNDHKDMKLLLCPLPDCNHVWCKLCQRHVEAGTRHSCDGTLELDDLIKSRGWKYCPGCRTPTEKQGGCNHMTCPARGCNTHFCYTCGKSIVQSVRREDIRTALNDHYRRCMLFQDVPDRNERR